MAARRFNSQFNFTSVVGEPTKGDYIVERDTFLSPRDILRKYSLGLPIGDTALVQDEEYEDMPDDLVDLFPNAGEDDSPILSNIPVSPISDDVKDEPNDKNNQPSTE